jgi:hypothetical protein
MLYNPEWQPKPDQAIVLLKAANLIREHGLAKHTRQDDQGRFCTYGAVATAADGSIHGESKLMISTMRYLRSYMADIGIERDDGDIARWNNEPKRTAKQVIAVLEGAANAVQ